MATLQEQYNSINNGSGNKDQFLKQARSLFPQYFNQYTDFDTAINVLKQKSIISEALSGVVAKGFDIWDWKKILAEESKAEEKETPKEVKDANKNAFQPTDMKNADNVNFNEIMKGFYAEMRDEKNSKKTGDEIKAMVVKNLAKDPLFYTKDGMFGEKGVGFTTEAPGLGTPKEAKGKYKSSGYGDLKENINKINYSDLVNKSKDELQAIIDDKSSLSRMKKAAKIFLDRLNEIDGKIEEIGMFMDPIGYKKSELSDLDKMFTKEYKGNSIYVIYKNGEEVKTIEGEGNANAWINGEMKRLKKDIGVDENLVEQKLRSKIQQIIKEELNEISPDLFKRATDVARERGQDRRVSNMGNTFFNKFKNKPLMGGTIVDINYSKPQQSNFEEVVVVIEYTSEEGQLKNRYIYYDVISDEWAIDKEITRADARIFSLIAQHINPDTKYKSGGGSGFQIKGY
jgi:hypothetical protein